MSPQEIADQIAMLIEKIQKEPKTRERALAVTKLEEAIHWIAASCLAQGKQEVKATEILEWMLARYKEQVAAKFPKTKGEAAQ
jgi:hypothetical protein